MRSFTLVELIVVVLIVGILASFAMPQFVRTREHALQNEAISNLNLIDAAEKRYYLEQAYYFPFGALGTDPDTGNQDMPVSNPDSNVADINSWLRLSLNEAHWDYWIEASVYKYTAWAQRGDCRYKRSSGDKEPSIDPSSTCF